MGFNLLAFAGGAAKGLSEEMDKAEEEAKTYALASTKTMHERYAKLVKDNRELVDSASADLDIIKANYVGNAAFSEQQMYQIGINPAVRAQLVKAVTDKDVDLSTLSASQIIKMTEDNIPGTAKDRIAQAYKIPSMVATKADDLKKTGFFEGFGDRAGKTAAQKYANVVGVPLEQMQGAMQEQVKPVGTAEFDLSVLRSPKSTEAMQDLAQVAVVQAGIKFGPESQEYKDAATRLSVVNKYAPAVADTLEKRANRLNVAVLDEKDPAKKQELAAQLLSTQTAIKGHAAAISSKTDEDKQKAYSKIKTSALDYANNRMQNDVGASWRKFVEFKTIKLDDGTVHISTTKKQDMPLEEQQKMFKAEQGYMKESLVANEYIVDGVPMYDSVQELMNNYNLGGAGAAPANPKGLGARKPVAGSMTPKDEWVQAVPGRTDEQYDQAMKDRAATPMAVAPTPLAKPASPVAPVKRTIVEERAIANDAIRQGANADQVKKRFKEATGQDL
jgi:hypothetical protein